MSRRETRAGFIDQNYIGVSEGSAMLRRETRTGDLHWTAFGGVSMG